MCVHLLFQILSHCKIVHTKKSNDLVKIRISFACGRSLECTPSSMTGVSLPGLHLYFFFHFHLYLYLHLHVVEAWIVHILWLPLSLTGVYIVFDWTAPRMPGNWGPLSGIVHICTLLWTLWDIAHFILSRIVHCWKYCEALHTRARSYYPGTPQNPRFEMMTRPLPYMYNLILKLFSSIFWYRHIFSRQTALLVWQNIIS